MLFEIHITVTQLSESQKEQFLNFCNDSKSKAIFIELVRGHYVDQPMLTKVLNVDTVQQCQQLAEDLISQLQQAAFRPIRLKIEIPIEDFVLGSFVVESSSDKKQLKNYFEWHGKVGFINVQKLNHLCEQHAVHLSKNSLKDQRDYRFITLREYNNKNIFEQRIFNLKQALQQGDWLLLKEQSEYCIYDNNLQLDNGWLTHEYSAS